MMKKIGFFLLAIILLVSCSDKSGKIVMPNDRSAFVTLTDAVPDAIWRYAISALTTLWVRVSTVMKSLRPC